MPLSTREDVDDAVRAGQDAFASWRDLSWDKRAEYLVRFADAIEANIGPIAELLGKETGKPVEAAAKELEFALSHIRVTAKLRIPEQVLQDTEEVSAREPPEMAEMNAELPSAAQPFGTRPSASGSASSPGTFPFSSVSASSTPPSSAETPSSGSHPPSPPTRRSSWASLLRESFPAVSSRSSAGTMTSGLASLPTLASPKSASQGPRRRGRR